MSACTFESFALQLINPSTPRFILGQCYLYKVPHFAGRIILDAKQHMWHNTAGKACEHCEAEILMRLSMTLTAGQARAACWTHLN